MNQLFFRAVALGLSSGTFCLGFCLPVTIPAFAGSSRSGIKFALQHLLIFLFGRLVAYLITGFIFGLLGATVAHFSQVHRLLLPLLDIVLGALLIIYGIVHLEPFTRLAPCKIFRPGAESRWFLFLLGILIGLSPCPPFLLALTSVIELGGVKNGVLFFLMFFATSSLFFTPLTFIGIFNRYPVVRLASRILAVITGSYFIFLGLRLLL
ncbi:MAG: urease accessory protein UreH domain-containing protein [bacterium]